MCLTMPQATPDLKTKGDGALLFVDLGHGPHALGMFWDKNLQVTQGSFPEIILVSGDHNCQPFFQDDPYVTGLSGGLPSSRTPSRSCGCLNFLF